MTSNASQLVIRIREMIEDNGFYDDKKIDNIIKTAFVKNLITENDVIEIINIFSIV